MGDKKHGGTVVCRYSCIHYGQQGIRSVLFPVTCNKRALEKEKDSQ